MQIMRHMLLRRQESSYEKVIFRKTLFQKKKTTESLKRCKKLFSEKRKFANKITLEDSEKNILSDDTLVSEELNNFFQNAIKTLNINENSYIVDSSSSITDPVDKAINT